MRGTRSIRGHVVLCALGVAACHGDKATGPDFGGPAVPLALKFCAAVKPSWVGYQNGNGPWVTVSRDAGTALTYSFSINGGGGIAYVTPLGGDASTYGYSTEIVYATAEELQQFVVNGCHAAAPAGVKTIRGAMTGLGTNELGQINLGGSSSSVVSTNGTDATYTLRRVADTAQDLIAVRRTSLSSSGDIARIIVRRGINPADGVTLSSLDFNSAEAVRPVSATLSVTGSELGGLMSLTSSFATSGGSAVLFTGVQTTATAIPFTGVGLFAASGDLHILALSTQDSPTSSRATESYFRVTGDRTLVMGPQLGAISVTAVAGIPNVRFRMDIPSNSAYGTAAVAEISAVGFGPLNRSIELAVTAGYLGGVPATWQLTMPDLTTAPGFLPEYGISTGLGLDYLAIATGGNRQFFAAASDGKSLNYALREGSAVTNAKDLAGVLPLVSADGARNRTRAQVPADRPWRPRAP